MKKRTGGTSEGRGLVRAAVRGTGLALAVTLVLTAMAAAAVSKQWIPEQGAGYTAVVILIGSAWAGAWLGARQNPAGKAAGSMAAAGGYFAVLLILGALCFRGSFHGIPVTAAVIAGTAGAVSLLGLRQGKGRKRKYKRYGL